MPAAGERPEDLSFPRPGSRHELRSWEPWVLALALVSLPGPFLGIPAVPAPVLVAVLWWLYLHRSSSSPVATRPPGLAWGTSSGTYVALGTVAVGTLLYLVLEIEGRGPWASVSLVLLAGSVPYFLWSPRDPASRRSPLRPRRFR
jgi:hypothetical protein